jgi:AraC family transcriptional activator FtrA
MRYDPAMAPRSRPLRRRHLVAALAFDNIAPFELSVACEVFGLERPEIHDPWYEFHVCAADPPPLKTGAGFDIHTPYGLEDILDADTVIIPAWETARGEPSAEVIAVLQEAHRRGARMMSFCSGAFVLAAAGLLDGRRATTHWMHAEEMARRYPLVDVDPKVLYIDEGDILTSAGTAAGIDLCLHVVRKDLGAQVATAVARRMVVPPHRDGGQAQYVEQPVACCPEDDPMAGAEAWALEHLHLPLSVDELASRAAMSPRNFARRFRAVTGTTPLQWLLTQRVLLAQRLLEATDEPIELIASRCGLGSAANLRLHFQRQVGTAPQSYRRTFQQAEAS